MRTFLAINLPAGLRQRIWAAIEPLRRESFPIRWVDPELIHLTVKFLGEVSPETVDELAPTIGAVTTGCRAFDMNIDGVGGFPNLKRPRVLYADCEAGPQLEIVHDGVERAMQALGFPLEGRPFRPHLTLGRAARDARAPAWSGLNRIASAIRMDELAHVSSIDVMESRLHSKGPEYFVRSSVTLEG